MKVVILGANSLIARNLIEYLKGEDVTFLFYDYTEKQIDGLEPYVKIDPCKEESLSQIDFSADLIFDFVGKTGTWNGFDSFETYLDVNEKSLLCLLNAHRKANSTAKIIFPSSRLVYQGKKGQLKEDSTKDGKTIYAINKLACERYIEAYHNAFNTPYVIFRICVPYGSLVSGTSYGTAEFMFNRAKSGQDINLYGGGNQRRTFTHMKDLCRMLWLGANKCENDTYNIGGEDYSLNEIANLIAKQYPISVQEVEWEVNALKIESGDTVFDSTKLENVIGKQTYYPFTDWIKTQL